MGFNIKKIFDILKSITIITTIILIIFFVLEILARKKFNSFSSGSCAHEKLPDERLFYIPEKNCKFSFKHWESDKKIIYETDEKSNRVSSLPTNFENEMTTIAFFGDSFTWGEMNNVNQSYVHHTVVNLNDAKSNNAGYDNFGVVGYDFLQVLERIKRSDLNNYDHIVYGLTPNDLFSPPIKNQNKKGNKNLNDIKKNFLERSIKKIKLHNLRSIKVASKFLFDKFPNIYISLYTKRDLNLAGYLYSDSSEYWNERYLELFENLRSLDQNIKDQLIIQVIAQRVQVLLYKKGELNNALAFENRVKEICNKLGIKFNGSQLHKLANLEDSHFTIDGHFTPLANSTVGKTLAEFISNL